MTPPGDAEAAPSPQPLGVAEVTDFVIGCRGEGVILPYSDNAIVQSWLQAAPDCERLLLILAEILPDYFERARNSAARPPSLARVHKRVLRKLRDARMHDANPLPSFPPLPTSAEPGGNLMD